MKRIDAFRRHMGRVSAVAKVLIPCAGLLVGATGAAWAAVASDFVAASFSGYARLAEEQLDELRGGFVTASGVEHFSLKLSTLQGTALMSEFIISLTDAGTLSVNESSMINLSDAQNQVVATFQLGEGNLVPVNFLGANGLFNVVQNSLSDVVIHQNIEIRLDLAGAGLASGFLTQQLQSSATLGLR